VRHHNRHTGDAQLFRVDDSAVIRSLGVYQQEILES
jgi:hypothetical protein